MSNRASVSSRYEVKYCGSLIELVSDELVRKVKAEVHKDEGK